MASYTQWAARQKITRVTWVCGPEPFLQREVGDAYKAALPLAKVVLWGDDWSGNWDYLLSAPTAPRLVLVNQAELLKSLDHLPLLLDDCFDGSYTVFFSAEDDFRRTEAKPGDRKSRELIPAMAALRDSRHGQLVRCSDIRDDEGKVALVAEWWGSGRNLAAGLLNLCNGDLGTAREVVRKAHLAGLPPTEDTLRILASAEAGSDFADQLIAGNRRAAMDAAAGLAPGELGELLPLLSSRLGMLTVLGAAARSGRDLVEEGRRLKMDQYMVKLLRPHAAAYGQDRVDRCREILALAEQSWRAGAREGLAEAIAALW